MGKPKADPQTPDDLTPTPLSSSLQATVKLMTDAFNAITPEDRATEAAEEAARILETNETIARTRWNGLVTRRGAAYANCWFANYEIANDRQRNVVAQLREYGNNVEDRVKNGQNIFIYGPSETGKDHLLMALARQAIRAGICVRWENGMRFYSRLRQAMAEGKADWEVIDDLLKPKVLWLSDPLPPSIKAVRDFQGESIFLLIDERRNHLRPTWITLNAKDMEQAEDRIGDQTVNRLTLNGLTLHSNWERYKDQRE